MDLISRKAAIEYLMTNMGWIDEDGYAVDDADEKRAHIEDLINGVPTIDAATVVHGRWINMKNGNADCSVCGRHVVCVYDDDNADKYCRCCGAKMDLEEHHD